MHNCNSSFLFISFSKTIKRESFSDIMLISPSISFPLLLINKYIGKIKRNKDIFFPLKHLKNLFLIYDSLNAELLLIKKNKT